ncbi:MAG TPA: hypothetical protein VES65_02050 [Solirubrobacteraceae bacterium]|nr:hypothetical protein [Solirubrobacteraceae bacterium]
MAAPLATNSADNLPWKSSPAPKLTVPQLLAFLAFLIIAGMTLFKQSTIGASEYDSLKRLCIFLIAALLPSDALIRFGRSRLMAATEAAEGGKEPETFPEKMQRATLPQVLAFAAFIVMCVIAILGKHNHGHFAQVAEVASILIAALLPSEAVTRFGRALWLAKAPAARVTDEALTRV